jgi:hypothetical protein
MKKSLLMVLFALLCSWATQAQVSYEDFEGGTADLPWIGLNGAYNGSIANPDATGANTSAFVGSYTNNGSFDFCFALADFPAALDISQFNQFKMKIWSPTAPCQALLKLEGFGGPPVEKFINITEANKWVEYTFDFSAAANQTNLKKILVSFNSFVLGDNATYYFDDIRAEKAERCYADFEGPGLNFLGLDGTLTSPEPNPAPNSVNSSPNCAKYIKSGMHAYSLILADNGTPFDLTTYNQFKMKIYATAPTQVLLKLEGSGGAIEKIKNIAVTNAWQEYTFDFSAQAANTGISKIVMFFDPGVETSTDTYYFDDVCAVPNPCPNSVPNPIIVDDFECNRNATYSIGWDSLTVISNPGPSGENSSSKVGRFQDPAGAGTEYAALVVDYQDPLNLSINNQFSCQVWAPKTGLLLLKIEGGGAPKEIGIPVTQINQWITYTADFSSEVGKPHNKLVLFFNAGQNGQPDDVYFIDNLKLGPDTGTPPLEDFEGGLNLGWSPLDGNNPIHGNFTGPTSNPSPNSVNGSAEVGCYAKGASAFSTLQAFSLTAFNLSALPQFNIDVLSPASGGTVTMQLSSPTQGNKEATATVTSPGVWETLKFDFSTQSGITDFAEVRLLFNAGTAAEGQSWCIDNLRQSEVTVDPCAGVVPVPNIVDDYECQRNYTQVFYGASDLSVVNNPVLSPSNGSTKVGKYNDPAGAGTEFAGIGIEFATPPDLSVYNQLSFQVLSPFDNVPFLIKMEGGQQVEVFDTLPTAGLWHKFNIDFTSALGKNNNKIVIFFNVLSATGGGTYYIDNIRWQRAGFNGCIADHDTPGFLTGWTYFANGSLETQGYQFEIVDNPSAVVPNTSAKVGKFVKAGDALPFAGMYTNPNLEAPIDWKGVKTLRAKVLMDHLGNLGMKVEGSATGAPSLELKTNNTKVNEWEELSFDFSTVPDNGEYQRLTLFFDLGIDATGQNVTSYFDDITIGLGNCQGVGNNDLGTVAPLRLMPNPATDKLYVQQPEGASFMEVYNLFGQRVASITVSGDFTTDLDVVRFPAGMYQIATFNEQGRLVASGKFVKR